MTEYTVHLPDVDIHLHGEEFFNAITELSNTVDDEGRPLFVTQDLAEAMRVVKRSYAICHENSSDDEFNIRVTQSESKNMSKIGRCRKCSGR